MNHYEVLEVDKKASAEEIKKQYKKMALQHHPDRGGDPEKFKQISEAYQILSDTQKRKQYDAPSFPLFRTMPRRHAMPRRDVFYNDDFFKNPFQNININIGSQMSSRSVSTTIQDDIIIQNVVEICDSVKTETITRTNMKTGQVQKTIYRSSC
tara:strand:+ start:1178 stop:1636 length:459 start_codon:yes stop_codon:yes gene_type:complete